MVRYKKLDSDKFSLKLNSVQNQFPILETDALKITFTLDIINLKTHLNFPCLEIIMFSAIRFVVTVFLETSRCLMRKYSKWSELKVLYNHAISSLHYLFLIEN